MGTSLASCHRGLQPEFCRLPAARRKWVNEGVAVGAAGLGSWFFRGCAQPSPAVRIMESLRLFRRPLP